MTDQLPSDLESIERALPGQMATFAVQRNHEQCSALGSQLYTRLKEFDRLVMQRGADHFQVTKLDFIADKVLDDDLFIVTNEDKGHWSIAGVYVKALLGSLPTPTPGAWTPIPTTVCTEKVQYTPSSLAGYATATKTHTVLWDTSCCGEALGGDLSQAQIDQLVMNSNETDGPLATGIKLTAGQSARFRMHWSTDAYYFFGKSDDPMDREYRKGPAYGITLKLKTGAGSTGIVLNGNQVNYAGNQSFSTSVLTPDVGGTLQEYVDVDLRVDTGELTLVNLPYCAWVDSAGVSNSYWLNSPNSPITCNFAFDSNQYAVETPLDLKYKKVTMVDRIDGKDFEGGGYDFDGKHDCFNAIRRQKLGDTFDGCP